MDISISSCFRIAFLFLGFIIVVVAVCIKYIRLVYEMYHLRTLESNPRPESA